MVTSSCTFLYIGDHEHTIEGIHHEANGGSGKRPYGQGNVWSKNGIMVYPMKIEAVYGWVRPTSPSEVHSFVEFEIYYRWFVEGFSLILGRVISYTSRKMKLHDKNHPTHDLELVVGKSNVEPYTLSQKALTCEVLALEDRWFDPAATHSRVEVRTDSYGLY
ncbi:hypothetical protein MTR67_026751, partial [Solanum verrucosum]